MNLHGWKGSQNIGRIPWKQIHCKKWLYIFWKRERHKRDKQRGSSWSKTHHPSLSPSPFHSLPPSQILLHSTAQHSTAKHGQVYPFRLLCFVAIYVSVTPCLNLPPVDIAAAFVPVIHTYIYIYTRTCIHTYESTYTYIDRVSVCIYFPTDPTSIDFLGPWTCGSCMSLLTYELSN